MNGRSRREPRHTIKGAATNRSGDFLGRGGWPTEASVSERRRRLLPLLYNFCFAEVINRVCD